MKRIVPLFLLSIISLPLIIRAADGPGDPCPFQVNLGADTMICSGSSLRLSAEVPGATYHWSDWSTTPEIQVFFEGEYTVTVTKDGCEVSDTIYVGLKPSLYADFSYLPNTDSTPATLSFTDMSSSCDGTVTEWTWDFGDGHTSSQRNPVHNYSTPGDYDVVLSVKDNFGSIYPTLKTITVESVTDTTPVEPGAEPEPQPEPEPKPQPEPDPDPTPLPDPQPNPPVIPSDTSTRTCDGLSKPLIVQNENTLKTGNASSYKWYRGGVLISGANEKMIRVNQQGYYAVKITDSQGCEIESDSYFFMPIAEKESSEEVRIKCSPNPGNGIINIILSEVPEKPAKLTIYNFHGTQLFTTYVSNHVNPLYNIRLAKGMYMVELLINGKRKTITAVVQ